MKRGAGRSWGAGLLALALLLCAGCARTVQTRAVEPAGFLGDYTALQPGKGQEALMVYIDPEAHFADYDRILLEPVTVWHHPGSTLEGMPDEELQRLADYLEASMREELGRDFELVDRAGPRTLRVRLAITEARGAPVALDIASTVLPPTLLLSEASRLATGTHLFVGRAAIEGEIADAISGRRLVAVVDERAGGKTLEGKKGSWSDVEAAYDYWAAVLRTRLMAFRDFDAAERAAEAASGE